MHDQLIGYLLCALERDEVAQLEQLLQAEAELRRQLEVLRRGLVPLQAGRQAVDAPRGLAVRTCQRIQQARFS